MTITRLPTSLITTGSQNGQRLKEIFLVSVTASALLLGSLGVAHAQSADDVLASVKAVEAMAPAGSISSDTQKEIDKANQAGSDYVAANKDAQTKQADAATAQATASKAASDVASAQKALNDAQAKLDATNEVYSGAASAAVALNKAVTEYNTQKGWLDTATKSLAIANQGQAAFDAALKSTDADVKKAVAGYSSSDFAKFKVDAAAGFANAQTKTYAAQYVAQVAADVVRDPKNGLAPLQKANGDLQSAQAALATAKQANTDAASKATSAGAAAKTAQDTANAKLATLQTQGVKAFNDANSEVVSFQNKPAAPAKPSAPGNVAVVTPGTPVVTPAPIVVTPTAPGAGLISEHGAGVISNDGGSIISHDAGSIISHDAGSVISKSSSGVLTDNGMLATGSPGNKIISDNSEGLLSEHGAGAASNSAAGYTMKGAGISAYSASSTTPDRELNDQTAIRDAKNQLSSAQLAVNAAQTASNNATSDFTAAQAAVKAAQDKVDALNKTFSGAKSAGDALTAAVKDYNNEKSWLDKASASLALANQGQAAFDAARNSKDPAVAAPAAGYTDYAKFKADATSGYANALDKTNKAQYVAQVAADVVKDPKNGLAPLQKANGDLQAAQTTLATKQQASTVASTKLASANTTVTQLNSTITTTQADLDAYHQQQQVKPAGQQGNINVSGIKGSIDPPPTPSATPGRSETSSPAAGSLISNASNGVLTDNGMLATGSKIISDHSEGLISEHGAGAIAQSSALLASLPAASAQQVTASAAFKQDSTISANANITTPDQDLKNAVNRLSAQDSKTLSDLKAQVASGKPLTADQANQVSAISDKIAKNMDPANVKSLQTSIAAKSGTSTGSPAGTPATTVAAVPSAVTASAPNLPGSSSPATPPAAPAANPAGSGAPASNTQVVLPNGKIEGTGAIIGNGPVIIGNGTVEQQAAKDMASLSRQGVQQIVQAGPQVLDGFQKMLATEKDPVKIAGIKQDMARVSAEIKIGQQILDPNRKYPTDAPAGSPTTVPTATATAPAASGATPPATGPQVAAVKPDAASPPSSPALASAPSKPAEVKTDETEASAKLTADQGKAVHQALRTIPGNLSKSDQKQFDTLSTLVDKATTKGLTPVEAAMLKAGLAALADKHPKAEKQHGLNAIGNSVAIARKPEEKPAIATREGGKAEPGKPVAVPPMIESKGAPPTTTMPDKNKGIDMVKQPEQKGPDVKPEQAIARTNPTAPVGEKKDVIPEHHMPNGTAPVAHANPTPPPSLGGGAGAGEKKDMIPEHHMQQPPPKQAVATPTPPKPVTPPPAAPKPPALAGATAPKPAAPPAAKPQSCTPNMVGGKMMGMICH